MMMRTGSERAGPRNMMSRDEQDTGREQEEEEQQEDEEESRMEAG